jgi:hypothetical protein
MRAIVGPGDEAVQRHGEARGDFTHGFVSLPSFPIVWEKDTAKVLETTR